MNAKAYEMTIMAQMLHIMVMMGEEEMTPAQVLQADNLIQDLFDESEQILGEVRAEAFSEAVQDAMPWTMYVHSGNCRNV